MKENKNLTAPKKVDKISVDGQLVNFVADFSAETTQIIELAGLPSGLFVQCLVASQCQKDHHIDVIDGEKNHPIDVQGQTGGEYKQQEGKSFELDGNSITLKFKTQVSPLITKNTVMCDGTVKCYTYTFALEDEMEGDNDYNDIFISLTIWTKKN